MAWTLTTLAAGAAGFRVAPADQCKEGLAEARQRMGRPVLRLVGEEDAWHAVDQQMVDDGLSVKSATMYVRSLRQAETWCEERGTTLGDIDAPMLATYSNSLAVPSRKVLRGALKRYWTMTGGEDRPLYAVRIPRKPRILTSGVGDDAHRRLVQVRQRLREEGMSKRTVQTYSNELRRAESWCEARGWTLLTVRAEDIAPYCESVPKSWSGRKVLRSHLR